MRLTPGVLEQAIKLDQAGTADVSANLNEEWLTPAGVLVPLVERRVGDHFGYHVLLTRRARHLKNHAGQISFPGGRQEDYDDSLKHTALRETYEEIGIKPSQVKIIGELPQHTTITKYVMTPFVGILPPTYSLTIDPSEVDEAFEVPLSFILDKKNQQLQSAMFQGEKRYYYSIQYHSYNIWGATARILVEFSKRIHHTFDHCLEE